MSTLIENKRKFTVSDQSGHKQKEQQCQGPYGRRFARTQSEECDSEMSCITKIPIAILPCVLFMLPVSSRIFTAKIVLEKLSANAMRKEVCHVKWMRFDKLIRLSRKMISPNIRVVIRI
jgi:hypothetical protein